MANDLFQDEDRLLLDSKIMEKLPVRAKSGSVYPIEVNNIIVLVSGSRSNPVFEAVIVVNADNRTDYEIIKSIYLEGVFDGKLGKNKALYECVRIIQRTTSKENIIGYYGPDYRASSRDELRKIDRATLPDNFKNFSYTKDGQKRGGLYQADEDGVSGDIQRRHSYEDDINKTIDKWSREAKARAGRSTATGARRLTNMSYAV